VLKYVKAELYKSKKFIEGKIDMERKHQEEYRRIIGEKIKEAEKNMNRNDPDDAEYFKILDEARARHSTTKKRKRIRMIILLTAVVSTFVIFIWLRVFR